MFIFCSSPHIYNPFVFFFNHSIDGQEPEYMVVNPGEWLSTTLQKCCKKHFNGYYYDQCLFLHPPPALQGCSDPLLFYPDWHGSNEGCLDDGKCKLSTRWRYLLTSTFTLYNSSHVVFIISSSLLRRRAVVHATK